MTKTVIKSFTFFLFFSLLLFNSSCGNYLIPQTEYGALPVPAAPDYSDESNWAALPQRKDKADRTPEKHLKDEQDNAEVDVFYLHPTTYSGDEGKENWNGALDDKKINRKTDKGAILFQASVFNGAGKVYAPRYRQAHYHAYFSKNKEAAKRAFALAYEDVKAAFDYYLQHYNKGRPFILAGHSQGTNHAERLLKEYFDGKPLQKKLVAAYLVGMPIKKDAFKNIKVCETPEETNCFCTWRSYLKDYYPSYHKYERNVVVTNPIIWTVEPTYAEKSLNEGTILRKFKKGFKKGITDAQVHKGLLWINKPKFFGSAFIRFKNYHIADYNLFYANIRKNAQLRASVYLKQQKGSSK